MLEITLANQKLDLPDDIAIDLQMENPLFSSDRIPVGFAASFDIPDTAHNLKILGHPERIAGGGSFLAERLGKIRYAGATIADGTLVIEEVGSGAITLHFVAAILPDAVSKKLFEVDFETQHLGRATIFHSSNGESKVDTSVPSNAWNSTLVAQTAKEAPDFVAPTMKIDGAEFVIPDEPEEDRYSNLAAMFANPFNNHSHRFTYGVSPNVSNEFGKIIPSFRVGWLLRKILPSLPETVFDTILKRLLLVCSYHPAYNDTPNSPLWTMDPATHEVSVRMADFMPDVETRELLIEALKMVCGSLYISGSTMSLELNRDILAAPCEIDWSERLLDGYTISAEAGQDYTYGYNCDSSSDAAPETFVKVGSIAGLLSFIKLARVSPWFEPVTRQKYYVAETGQYLEAVSNPSLTPDNGNSASVHYDFKVLATDRGSSTTDDSSKREAYDATLSAEVVECNIVTQVKSNPEYVPQTDTATGVSAVSRYYCPVIDKPERRPADMVFGLWAGLVNFCNPGPGVEYPCVTMSGVDPAGTRKSPVSLCWSGQDGLLATFHSEFRAWLAKDKRLLKCDLLLGVDDLHSLDLRRKVHIRGVDLLIRSITFTLSLKNISPAEAELIEL